MINNNDVINKWDYLGLAPQVCGVDSEGSAVYCDDPPTDYHPPLFSTEEALDLHFWKLKYDLTRQLKSLCPKSAAGWEYKRYNKNYCCKPKNCMDEAERMAEAYIKALKHAYSVRKYPGGGWGNYYIVMDGGWRSGQTYDEVEDTGLTCGGWSDMGQRVLEPMTDKSECWTYIAEKHWSTIEAFGYTIWCPHMWSSLQIMNGDKIHLDPWKSGGFCY